ncbi:hypothetical protein [Polycladidibacter hongkongensis]|uniref:hypothetical protein n=1 Tax=Polycladidibacter hongkongensis TaxID=1647556 RepID=UPI0008362902|nr:hypothetical protein [Pseudovibrio hongkongensis]
MSDNCISCTIFGEYEANSSGVVDQVMGLIYEPMLSFFIAIVAIWVVVRGVQLNTGGQSMAAVAREFMGVCIGFVLMVGLGEGLVSSVFSAVVTTLSSLAAQIMGAVQGNAPSSGIVGLVGAVENGLMFPIYMVDAAIKDSTVFGAVAVYLWALALAIPFFLLMISFVSQVVVALFRVTIICSFSPFIVMVSSFPWGREALATAIRLLLNSMFVVCFVTAAFALILSNMQGLLVADPNAAPSEAMGISSPTYLASLFLAWCGTALVSEAVNISGMLSSAIQGNSAAGAIAGGGTMASKTAAKKALSVGFGAGKMAVGAIAGKIGEASGGKPKVKSPNEIIKTEAP